MGIRKTNPYYKGLRTNLTGSLVSYIQTTAPYAIYSVAPYAIYSLRLLNSSYSGNCIKVRRSSDNTTKDIGFVNGVLDTATLLTFCGSGNGYIVTWYDQQINAWNATQNSTTNQPQIVNSGAVMTQNNKPTIYFSGLNFLTTAAGFFAGLNNFSLNFLFSGLTKGNNCIFGESGTYNQGLEVITKTNNSIPTGVLNAGTTFLTSNSGLWKINNTLGITSIVNSTTGSSGYLNGSLVTTGSSMGALTYSGAYCIGSFYNANYSITGYIPEFIFFNSSISTIDRQNLEHNQESYFNITGV